MQLPVHGLGVPAHALVTGASSGIGLAMVGDLLATQSVAKVHAVSRKAETFPTLLALQARHPGRLNLTSADLSTKDGVALVAARVSEVSDSLHLVVNCAGLLHARGLRPERSLTNLDQDTLADVFALNAFAPVLLARALLPQLGHGGPLVLASLSARIGSIGDNHLGGWYAYRASKAALNQLMRTLSIEWRRTHPQAICVLLHPGTVDTPLSKPFQGRVPAAQLSTPDVAARALLQIIAGLTPADSGRFISWDGTDIPW